ncbi:hypothetical protein KUCAC02_029134 [Chaenocephalus aceratus]|uniref:Uncharacterized protein n=1 Tax=Chaenocephalus aceratus TaxID=36190 RepID=A0ACB9X5H8_CHAAC|nr:hypothetical protein KUCAC02_029134 [Chaenocephalus aceratus]
MRGQALYEQQPQSAGPFSGIIPLILRQSASPRFCSPGIRLTSPAVVVAVLAVDAALGVGDRCRVTNAMAGR